MSRASRLTGSTKHVDIAEIIPSQRQVAKSRVVYLSAATRLSSTLKEQLLSHFWERTDLFSEITCLEINNLPEKEK